MADFSTKTLIDIRDIKSEISSHYNYILLWVLVSGEFGKPRSELINDFSLNFFDKIHNGHMNVDLDSPTADGWAEKTFDKTQFDYKYTGGLLFYRYMAKKAKEPDITESDFKVLISQWDESDIIADINPPKIYTSVEIEDIPVPEDLPVLDVPVDNTLIDDTAEDTVDFDGGDDDMNIIDELKDDVILCTKSSKDVENNRSWDAKVQYNSKLNKYIVLPGSKISKELTKSCRQLTLDRRQHSLGDGSLSSDMLVISPINFDTFGAALGFIKGSSGASVVDTDMIIDGTNIKLADCLGEGNELWYNIYIKNFDKLHNVE